MLQQTRVEVVIERWKTFMLRFPDPAALAAASEDEVLAEWSGLGYYRRARMLHAASQELVARGGFPASAAALRELPGVGAYTAAAVASICFNQVIAAIDGNVERVVARRVALEEDPKRAAGRRVVTEIATGLLDPQSPGDSVQAMMELGATVCRPRRPRCSECPLVLGCQAFETATVEQFPVRPARREPTIVRRVVALVRDEGGRLLLIRRQLIPGSSQTGVAVGMWELPNVDVDPGGAWVATQVAARLAVEIGGHFEWTFDAGSPRPLAKHSITHHRITYEVCSAHWSAGVADQDVADQHIAEAPIDRCLLRGVCEATWVSEEELNSKPIAAMVGKCLSAATKSEEQASG